MIRREFDKAKYIAGQPGVLAELLALLPLDNPVLRSQIDFSETNGKYAGIFHMRNGQLELTADATGVRSSWTGDNGVEIAESSTGSLGQIAGIIRRRLNPRFLKHPRIDGDENSNATAINDAVNGRDWKRAADLLWQAADYVAIANAFFAATGDRSFLHRVADAPDETPDAIDFVKCLLRDGADADAVSHNGYTALHLACLNGHAGIASLLAESMALDWHNKTEAEPPVLPDVLDAADAIGNTALHLAAAGGHHVIVEELKNLGAATDIKNRNGETALDLALKGIPDKGRMVALSDEQLDAYIRRHKNKFMTAWNLDWDCPDPRFHWEAVNKHFAE